MSTANYEQRRAQIEHYFDRTAADTWAKLTSDVPVSGIRRTVRAGWRSATQDNRSAEMAGRAGGAPQKAADLPAAGGIGDWRRRIFPDEETSDPPQDFSQTNDCQWNKQYRK